MRTLPFWFLLFVYLVPSSFAADLVSSASIREIQVILSLKGLYDGRLDGLTGPKTERAILRYEQKLGWPLTGAPSGRLLEGLRMERESALQGGIRGNDDQKTSELLKRDLDHTQAHLDAVTSDVKAIQRANVDNLLSLQSALRAEGLMWLTLLVAFAGTVVTLIGGMVIRKRVKTLKKEHRTLTDIARADISTYIFCVLGGRCIDLYAHLNPVSDTRYHGYLDMGVGLSTIAYQYAMYLRDNYSKIDKKGLSDDMILTVNACVNNYVFYLGERASEQDKQNARGALNELSDISERYERENTMGWWKYKETLLYAKLNFGWERPHEIQRELQCLFDDPRVPRRWTEKIKDRYEQHYNAARHLTGSEVIDLTIRTGQ